MTRRTILLYHRVARDPGDPYGLCVDPDRFCAQLGVLRDLVDIVPLDDLVARPARHGTSRRRSQVALTFDDGYADNLIEALPALERHDTPITLFVASGLLGDPRGFWWDRLATLLVGRQHVDLDLRRAGVSLRISLHGPRAGSDALVALHSRLRLLDVAAIDTVLEHVARQLRAEVPRPHHARVLWPEELEKMASSPLVTVGAHTVDHRLLAGLPREDQERTMRSSARVLEELLDRGVRHFAYPYDDPAAVDDDSFEAARRCGFATACTTSAGRVTALSDRLRLPRRMVRDWDADTFRSHLLAWRSI